MKLSDIIGHVQQKHSEYVGSGHGDHAKTLHGILEMLQKVEAQVQSVAAQPASLFTPAVQKPVSKVSDGS